MDVKVFSDLIDAREIESFSEAIKTTASVRDIDGLIGLMKKTHADEDKIADFISEQFRNLANAAQLGADVKKLEKDVRAFRDALVDQRKRLIKQEIRLSSSIKQRCHCRRPTAFCVRLHASVMCSVRR